MGVAATADVLQTIYKWSLYGKKCACEGGLQPIKRMGNTSPPAKVPMCQPKGWTMTLASLWSPNNSAMINLTV